MIDIVVYDDVYFMYLVNPSSRDLDADSGTFIRSFCLVDFLERTEALNNSTEAHE